MSDDEHCGQVSSGDESQDYVDTKRWRASAPPEEVFTESENNREWGYDIIGEEVDENGKVIYEVRWDDWARKNGTKTTWSTCGTINASHWRRQQQKIRRCAAQDSLEIEIDSTTGIHNMETYLTNQAYKEKLQKAQAMPRTNLLLKLAELQKQADETSLRPENEGSSSLIYPKRSSQRATTRQKSEISLANSVRGTSASSAWRSLSSVPTMSSFTPVSSLKSNLSRSATADLGSSLSATHSKKGKHQLCDSDGSGAFPSKPKAAVQENGPSCGLKKRVHTTSIRLESEDETEKAIRPKRRRLSTDTHSPAFQRSQLEKEWTKISAQHKAAPIHIVNTVDAEPVPSLPPGFLYLESRYQFSSDVPQPSHMKDFLVKCSSRYCDDVARCECQAASALVDDTGSPMLAYTPEGFFAFNVPKGTEVVECNTLCECSVKSCWNRVSQRPRDVPIEIFKTETRGWGVRPLVDIRRGKVLGLYTGLVIPRESAHSLPEHKNSDYVFDLDGDENDEDHPIHHPVFSVDSRSCGNWTRFINHSCAPNLEIYLVVHDLPPANGLPFIAFVALENIPAKTEFTLDYDPRAAERMRKGKKKGQPTVPEGAKLCICGANACRGVLY